MRLLMASITFTLQVPTLHCTAASLSKVLSSDRGLGLKPRTKTAVSSSPKTGVLVNTFKMTNFQYFDAKSIKF